MNANIVGYQPYGALVRGGAAGGDERGAQAYLRRAAIAAIAAASVLQAVERVQQRLAAPASAITPSGTPPTFYCDANRPANADTVEAQLNTRAKNGSAIDADRGNQPRWERATASFALQSTGSDPLPSTLTWAFFNGHEIDRYLTFSPPHANYPGIFIGSYLPAGQPQLPANHLYYMRYRFKLESWPLRPKAAKPCSFLPLGTAPWASSPADSLKIPK